MPGFVLQLFGAGGRGGDPAAVDPMQAGQAYNTAIGCVLTGPGYLWGGETTTSESFP